MSEPRAASRPERRCRQQLVEPTVAAADPDDLGEALERETGRAEGHHRFEVGEHPRSTSAAPTWWWIGAATAPHRQQAR